MREFVDLPTVQRNVFRSKIHQFEWIDVLNPNREVLDKLATKYNIHPTSVEDCLDPEHLPKYEKIDDNLFIIARAYDMEAGEESDTVQELTRKIAIFIGDGYVLTIHRRDQPFFDKVIDQWTTTIDTDEKDQAFLVITILHAILKTYERPLQSADKAVDQFEIRIFNNESDASVIRDLYFFKRQMSVIRKMLRLTLDLIRSVARQIDHNHPIYQDMRETLDEFIYISDELQESVNNLINVHLSLASHRNNEVVRVLTLFSVFFLPITFIAGVYGMNFKIMPELTWQYGYAMAWGMMIAVVLIIYLWFQRKGWL